jgi:iron complex outermembrane receptor protein
VQLKLSIRPLSCVKGGSEVNKHNGARRNAARLIFGVLCGLSAAATAQEQQKEAEETTAQQGLRLEPVVVTATRIEQLSFDLPVAIDSISTEQIQDTGKPGVNISEQLNRVPGTVVQNRESYAQEQQITIRGFGARSQFGTRGIKLLADGIPASTPDGQGSPGLFDLDSAKSIEVLRGPFSALYGNHSGGVVQIFTEDGPPVPTLSGGMSAGGWGSWKARLKFGGTTDSVNYIGSLSRFETEGYRDHSFAQKDQFNAKLGTTPTPGSSLTFVVNYLNQPGNLDPLGLTAAQVSRNPRQADPSASAFDTRRNLDNLQAGFVYENRITDADTLRAMAYVGDRDNDAFLAIPLTTQNGIRQSGGDSVLKQDFWGVGARWTHKSTLANQPLTLTSGVDYDTATGNRKGYINNLGDQGALKRDEGDAVDSYGGYIQAEWEALSRLSLSGGVRYSLVRFDSTDHFICTTTLVTAPGTAPGLCSGSTTPISTTNFNPDDSGAQNYSAWTPVAGVLYKVTPQFNLYANAGRSFETPTFIELAYRADSGSGLNFGLKPSKSTHYEIGAKAFPTSRTRMDLAVFQINTHDEIVVFTNVGGRSTYQNAGDTRRQGVELSVDSELGAGFNAYLALTYLDARFTDPFRTCVGTCAAPNATVNPNNKIPGVPPYTAYGELTWRHAFIGFVTGLEARTQEKVYVNDINSESADAYTTVSWRAGFEQRRGSWRIAEFVRVDNIFDREYMGAVAVNDANGRYYFPAPTRSLLIGGSVGYQF